MSAPNLANQWRELIGPVVGAEEVSFNANAAGNAGAPIDIQLSGKDTESLKTVSEAIKNVLRSFDGLNGIKDNFSDGKNEIQLKLKPSADSLGLTHANVGSQVRAAFYGIEAQRIQRGNDDIKIMVRYPKNERISIHNLDSLMIMTPSGERVPLKTVANYSISEGFSTINRINQRRVLNITADADKILQT